MLRGKQIDQWLTHWGRVTHICVGNLTIIGSDNGLSPGRHQAIIWTNAGILLIEPLGTNFSEIFIEIHTFSFKKMHLKMSSTKWRPFCLCLNELTHGLVTSYEWHHRSCSALVHVIACLPVQHIQPQATHHLNQYWLTANSWISTSFASFAVTLLWSCISHSIIDVLSICMTAQVTVT